MFCFFVTMGTLSLKADLLEVKSRSPHKEHHVTHQLPTKITKMVPHQLVADHLAQVVVATGWIALQKAMLQTMCMPEILRMLQMLCMSVRERRLTYVASTRSLSCRMFSFSFVQIDIISFSFVTPLFSFVYARSVLSYFLLGVSVLVWPFA